MKKELAYLLEDDFSSGAETVEIVFGIVFAVGLGAALLAFQGVIYDAFGNAQNSVKGIFSNLTNAAGKTPVKSS